MLVGKQTHLARFPALAGLSLPCDSCSIFSRGRCRSTGRCQIFRRHGSNRPWREGKWDDRVKWVAAVRVACRASFYAVVGDVTISSTCGRPRVLAVEYFRARKKTKQRAKTSAAFMGLRH